MYKILSVLIINLTFIQCVLPQTNLHASKNKISIPSNKGLVFRHLLSAGKSHAEEIPLYFTVDPDCTIDEIEVDEVNKIYVFTDITVAQLKIKIILTADIHSNSDHLILYYDGKPLENEDVSISVSGISENSTVHLTVNKKQKALLELHATGIDINNYHLFLINMGRIESKVEEDLKLLMLMRDAGFDLDARPNYNLGLRNTILQSFMSHPNLRLAYALMEYGVDVNFANYRRCTALMFAVCNKQVDTSMIAYLLGKGATVNAMDFRGRAALDYAYAYGSVDVQTYLRDAGAKTGDEIRREEMLEML